MSMASLVTLTNLILAARQKADMVGNDFCTDAEITGYINKSISELYDLLLTTTYGDEYFIAEPAEITLTGAASYSLEDEIHDGNFYKLKGIDIKDGNQWRTLKRFMWKERNRQRDAATNTIDRYRYRLMGNTIQFESNDLPTSGTIRVWYVPTATALVSGSDTFDSVNGWDEYVALDAAIKCLLKEESDASALVQQKSWQLKRITETAPTRDAENPDRVVDVHAVDDAELFDGPGGFYRF